jgi:hypothetical protein
MPPFAQRFRFIGGTRLLSVAKVVMTFGDFLDASETLYGFRYDVVSLLFRVLLSRSSDSALEVRR